MKFICVGRNYAEHIEEMHAARTKNPVIFLKPQTSFANGNTIYVPKELGELHYEVELCLRISKTVKNITEEESVSVVDAFTVGLDMTLREMQWGFKKNGLPWDLSKGFDNSASMGEWVDISEKNLSNMTIYLYLNDELKQKENTSLMIFSPYYIISYVSRFITMEKGDIIMTGTPKGVGKVLNGDIIRFGIENIIEKTITVRR